MSLYRVTGATAYRSHPPGSVFEAVLDPPAEARAIRRRNIELVARSKPSLVPGSYQLPARRDTNAR